MDKRFNPDVLLVVLRDHIGKNNGIKATDLVAEINRHIGAKVCNERDLRSVVERMREEGHHICAHPSSGYFIAANSNELDVTCEFLQSRALRSLKQIAAMRRVSMPTLFGQMNLPT